MLSAYIPKLERLKQICLLEAHLSIPKKVGLGICRALQYVPSYNKSLLYNKYTVNKGHSLQAVHEKEKNNPKISHPWLKEGVPRFPWKVFDKTGIVYHYPPLRFLFILEPNLFKKEYIRTFLWRLLDWFIFPICNLKRSQSFCHICCILYQFAIMFGVLQMELCWISNE